MELSDLLLFAVLLFEGGLGAFLVGRYWWRFKTTNRPFLILVMVIAFICSSFSFWVLVMAYLVWTFPTLTGLYFETFINSEVLSTMTRLFEKAPTLFGISIAISVAATLLIAIRAAMNYRELAD